MSLRTHAEFTSDLPTDQIEDASGTFFIQLGGRPVAEALREILEGLGCEAELVQSAGLNGWDFRFRYRKLRLWCQVSLIEGYLVIVRDRSSSWRIFGPTDHPDFIEVLVRLGEALAADSRFRDVGWFHPREMLSERAGASGPAAEFSALRCVRRQVVEDDGRLPGALRQWTVDAFAAEPFRGNPACVIEPLDAWPDEAWMQALAAENNQAETAFLRRTADSARFGLRWFTPKLEVPLCGHATLAAGHVLLAELGLQADQVIFDTHSGPLRLARAGEGYEMDFPAQPPQRIAAPAGLAEALGVEPLEVWAASYLVAILADEAAVRSLKPDLAALEQVASAASLGRGNVGVAAPAEPGRGYDVVDRFFAPGSGIPEDPATGSLHTILTPLFAARLGRSRLAFHQACPGRGGDLVCEDRGERVILGGRAVTMLEGRLRLRP